MSTLRASERVAARRVATLLVGSTATTALAVHLVAAGDARQLLDFGFEGLAPSFGAAADIFANNTRVLVAVLAACAAVQIGHAAGADAPARLLLRLARALCDGALVVGCGFNVLLVGAAFGAYGERTLAATLTHGPVELAAFSLALGLYLNARRELLAPRTLAATALVSLGLLAIAALLEAFA